MAVLLALCITAAACSDADPEPFSFSAPATDADAPVEGDGLQYGDSLQEWDAAAGQDSEAAKKKLSATTGLTDHDVVEWDDLIPAGFSDGEISARFADRLAAVEPGTSEADDIYLEMQDAYDGDVINEELDGTKIQMAGFVAPLTYEDDLVTEFLLVPYFGACIHVPPPPPNQTILVRLAASEGLTIDESYGAVWVAGPLVARSTTTDLATANYTMVGAVTGIYDAY